MTTPLRVARKARRLSLTDVAAAVGATPAHLSNIETAKASASPKLAADLARFFDGDPDEIKILYPERFQSETDAGDLPAGNGSGVNSHDE